jgi:TolB-like protein
MAALPITTIAGDPPPTTAPVAPVSVMLLPFHAVGQSGDSAWISEAIDEDLSHDLSRNAAIHLIRPATTQPMAAARDANAQRLISGSYQVNDDQLRITGEVIDVSQTGPAGEIVGEIKATGRVRDLFQLEDSLAMQLWHILPQPAQQTASNDIQVTPLEDFVNSQPAAPQVTPAPVYDAEPAYVPSVAGYPYDNFGYGYPYGYGWPLFIYGGYGYGFHHYGGGFHGSVGGGHFTGGGGRFFAAPHAEAPAARFGGGAAFGGHR